MMMLSGTGLPPLIQPGTADVLSDHVPAFEDLWMTPRAREASQGIEFVHALKAAPTSFKAPRQSD